MQPTPKDKAGFNAFFRHFAQRTSEVLGSPWAFASAVAATLVWVLSGPYFHYSDSWQLIINTGTTVITFLMIFLIQHTQNRDAKVIQMKLDELIRAIGPARTEMIQMETLCDEDLKEVEKQLSHERERAIRQLKQIEELGKRRAGNGRGVGGPEKKGDS
jgi:low affinity Fe/Cu permease